MESKVKLSTLQLLYFTDLFGTNFFHCPPTFTGPLKDGKKEKRKRPQSSPEIKMIQEVL